MPKHFPEGFLWGAATAPHQVEGNNVASDVWAMEHTPRTIYVEPSGDALDFYHLYRDDIAGVADIGLNALRLGVEWARIEPEPGLISTAELDHYSRIIDTCLERGVTPVVTLHHFSSPRWLLERRGWKNPDTAKLFADHAARVVARLGDRVKWFCTINEANTPMQLSANGLLPPATTQMLGPAREAYAQDMGIPVEDFAPFFPFGDTEEASEVIIEAHTQAVAAIHATDGDALAGVTLSLQEQVAVPGGEEHAAAADERINKRWLRDTGTVGDFVGVQNYSRITHDENGRVFDTENITGNGLVMAPGSLAATVRQTAALTGKPILITEHGTDLSTERDAERIAHIRRSLELLSDAIEDGVDVRGYIHWCLADNWEWIHGYQGQFGLFEVDRATQVRTPRPSAAAFGEIARANAV